MLLSVLTVWFIPESGYGADYYRKVDGRLRGYEPFCLRKILRNATYELGEGCFLEDPTLILAGVSIDDWNSFYKSKLCLVSKDECTADIVLMQSGPWSPMIATEHT
jgi:hypothetical protein